MLETELQNKNNELTHPDNSFGKKKRGKSKALLEELDKQKETLGEPISQ